MALLFGKLEAHAVGARVGAIRVLAGSRGCLQQAAFRRAAGHAGWRTPLPYGRSGQRQGHVQRLALRAEAMVIGPGVVVLAKARRND